MSLGQHETADGREAPERDTEVGGIAADRLRSQLSLTGSSERPNPAAKGLFATTSSIRSGSTAKRHRPQPSWGAVAATRWAKASPSAP